MGHQAQLIIPFCRILNSFSYLFLFWKMLQLPQLCFRMKAVTAEGFGKEWEGWQEKVVAWNHTLINWAKLSLTPFVFKVSEIPLRLNCLRLASSLCPASFFFSSHFPEFCTHHLFLSFLTLVLMVSMKAQHCWVLVSQQQPGWFATAARWAENLHCFARDTVAKWSLKLVYFISPKKSA